ncbi:MAG: hypothetical protein WBV94_24500 [Blastocatellia bacterium]
MENPDITSKGDNSPKIIKPKKSRVVGKKLCEFFVNIAAHINRQRSRKFLAGFSLFLLFAISTYAVISVIAASGPRFLYRDKPFNELTKAGIDIRLDQSRSLFQVGILILGGLWGLLIAKRGEAALMFKDYPEVIMIVCATIFLIASFFFHTVYITRISDIYSDAGEVIGKQIQVNPNDKQPMSIPDVFAPNINYMFVSQSLFLISGVGIALLAFVSAYKFKPEKTQ